ncbi:MAG: DNA-binding protein [Bacteroidales bacterium]|nr:DNA-binding protein [Bacteroidales bacterium]
MKKVKVIVECGKDGRYSAFMDCYDYDFGLSGFGNTAKEAIADFYECVEEERAMCEKDGKTMPLLEFDIQYDVTSFLDYYAGILSKSGLEKITGINQKQLWHYSSGRRKPTRQTTLRIQDNLHRFAENLIGVQFVN